MQYKVLIIGYEARNYEREEYLKFNELGETYTIW